MDDRSETYSADYSVCQMVDMKDAMKAVVLVYGMAVELGQMMAGH